MRSIYIVCYQFGYKYFEDYLNTLESTIKNNIKANVKTIIYDNPEKITRDPRGVYLFCADFPKNFRDIRSAAVINFEQLTDPIRYERFKECLSQGLNIIDFDQYQAKINQFMYIPYQIHPNEHLSLTLSTLRTPKIYDVAFCSTGGSPRRLAIYNQLIKNKISVINIIGWKEDRDHQIAQAKILINIHYEDNCFIFEHLRCDRWVFAGMIVITENSLSDEMLDIKDLIIIGKYENLVELVIKTLKNYENVHNQLCHKLKNKARSIVQKRKLECLNGINKLIEMSAK